MNPITIHVTDECLATLRDIADRRGTTVADLLDSAMEPDMLRLLQQLGRQWMPRAQWNALLRGENCLLCHQIGSADRDTDEAFWVDDLECARLFFMHNQFVRGYSVLTCLEHVREPYGLEPAKAAAFFRDVLRAGRAVDDVFKPDKMNLEILGNSTPHLHCHIKPRYYGDLAPGIPIDQNVQTVLLTRGEYESRVDALRSRLSRGTRPAGFQH